MKQSNILIDSNLFPSHNNNNILNPNSLMAGAGGGATSSGLTSASASLDAFKAFH